MTHLRILCATVTLAVAYARQSAFVAPTGGRATAHRASPAAAAAALEVAPFAAARPLRLSALHARGRLLEEIDELDAPAPEAAGDDSAATAVAAPAAAAAPAVDGAARARAKPILEAEMTFWEGPPSWTEMLVPGISVLTVIGIVPFAASVARQAWVRYKFTSRRICVVSGINGADETQVIYSDITDVKFIYRMGGTVGDMVLTLTDGAKLEMRHVPEFRQVYRYIMTKVSPSVAASSSQMKAEDNDLPLPPTLMPESSDDA